MVPEKSPHRFAQHGSKGEPASAPLTPNAPQEEILFLKKNVMFVGAFFSPPLPLPAGLSAAREVALREALSFSETRKEITRKERENVSG